MGQSSFSSRDAGNNSSTLTEVAATAALRSTSLERSWQTLIRSLSGIV
jgi:hypothetical protein